MRILLPTLAALVIVPAALAASPRVQTISGPVSVNSGAALTVTSGDRSLTCLVVGAKAQAALARWGVGVTVAMACTRDGDRLLLTRLTRLGSKDGTGTTPTTTGTTPGTTGTTPHEPGTAPTTTGTTPHEPSTTAPPTTTAPTETRHDAPPPPPPTSTSPTSPPPPPPPAPPTSRDAHGIVTAFSSTSVTVKPDAGGDSLTCRITPATDSTSAAAKLSLGAHVAIVCRRDGDSYVLSGTTPIN